LTATVILDTGPLVALLMPREPRSAWATEALRVNATVVSCEAVVCEAFHLLRSSSRATQALRSMLAEDTIHLISMANEARPVTKLMERFATVPMSFADACLVRLSELHPRAVIVTLDSDFRVYRRNGRQVIPVLMPQ